MEKQIKNLNNIFNMLNDFNLFINNCIEYYQNNFDNEINRNSEIGNYVFKLIILLNDCYDELCNLSMSMDCIIRMINKIMGIKKNKNQ